MKNKRREVTPLFALRKHIQTTIPTATDGLDLWMYEKIRSFSESAENQQECDPKTFLFIDQPVQTREDPRRKGSVGSFAGFRRQDSVHSKP